MLPTSSISRQYLDSVPRREYTTSSAVFFSDTMRTVFPLMTADVISPVMTWDFPVPGGPWTTISSFLSIAVRMFSWELLSELM